MALKNKGINSSFVVVWNSPVSFSFSISCWLNLDRKGSKQIKIWCFGLLACRTFWMKMDYSSESRDIRIRSQRKPTKIYSLLIHTFSQMKWARKRIPLIVVSVSARSLRPIGSDFINKSTIAYDYWYFIIIIIKKNSKKTNQTLFNRRYLKRFQLKFRSRSLFCRFDFTRSNKIKKNIQFNLFTRYNKVH